MRKGATLTVIAFIVALLTVASCGGNQNLSGGNALTAGSAGQLEGVVNQPDGLVNQPQWLVNLPTADSALSIDDALAELDALARPEGVDSALWAELKAALEAALKESGSAGVPPVIEAGGGRDARPTKFISTPPTGEANRVNDLAIADNGDGTYTLTWHYRNLGDYGQNGTVGISDITPLAQHFGETYDPETEPDRIQAVIDGSGNGKVDIADVTAIAVSFGANLHHYRIEGAEGEAGPFGPVQDAALEEGTGQGRLSFTVELALTAGDWTRIVPVDSQGDDGTPSAPLQVPTVENLPPVAALNADPTEGEAPLAVEFDAGGSDDPDGDIVLYEWDWEGDGTWDEDSGSTPTSSHIYVAVESYFAAVRVTDDEGLTDTASVEITATGIQPNQPPVAAVTANPTTGDAPLTVEFDAGGSDDPDGDIVLYEWDWESDGTWDEDSGSNPAFSHEYTTPGDYSATVRVTDDEDATDTESVAISVGATEWTHSWGGSGVDYAGALCVDTNGNTLVTGVTVSFGAGSDDLILLAYSPSGDLLWQQAWGGTDADWGAAISVDAGGNVYVAGGTYSFGAGYSDLVLLKYSPTGSLLWQKTWGGADVEWATAMAVDATGDIYVAGETYSFGAGDSDSFLLKYSASGSLLWQKTWGGSGGDSASALGVDGSGNAYVVGTTALVGAGMFDFVLLKYSPSGSLLWRKTWGGGSGDLGHGLFVDAGGSAYVAGETYNFGAQASDIAVLKFSSSGDLLWQRMWGGSTYDYASAVSVDASGNVYVAGDTESYGAGDYDIALLKYSSAGELLGQKTWGRSRADQASAIALDGSGKLHLVGRSPNTYGTWSAVNGAVNSPNGTVTQPNGTETLPVGIEAPPDGVETPLDGVQDDGGGGADALVMKLDPSLW